MPSATYTVEVGWAAVASNAFTFGVSTLDGGDVLSSQLYTDFGGTYDDISADVRSIVIDRGRDDYLDGMPAGRLDLELVDAAGKYNPQNASSVLNGKLLPMRPIRVVATYSGTDYPLFRGFIQTIEYDPVNESATIAATDLQVWLQNATPTIADLGSTTTGAAIRAVLEAVGFTEGALMDLDDGDNISAFTGDGDTSALDLISGLLDAERGAFYAAGDGSATFRSRDTQNKNTTSVATIASAFNAIPAVELDRIANRVTVTRTGGTPQTVTNADSQGTYGWRDAPAIDTPYLDTDDDAARLGSWILQQRAAIVPPIRGLRLSNLTATSLTQLLTVELLDRITVTDTEAVSTSTDFIVQKLHHEITDAGKYHFWEATVQERPVDFFQFGVSVLDGDDVMAY